MQGFPKQEHQIDTITRKPERLAIDLLVEDIIENAATITTLKGGGLFGHTATCMSDAQYATIQNSIPFILAPPPGVLTFGAGDTQAAREDAKLLFYNNVVDFELESAPQVQLQIFGGCYKPHMSLNHQAFSTKPYASGKQQQLPTKQRHNSSWTSMNTTRNIYLNSRTPQLQLPTIHRKQMMRLKHSAVW